MKVATFNVNGITARLPRLLEWLSESAPDVVCLQELKTSDETFPADALRDAGYSAVWHGQKGFNGVAILARGDDLVERRRGLPGDPDDTHSRYIEADTHGLVVASIYLPNGNPQPGPKFAYKLAWFERLAAHAQSLIASEQPVVLAGDYNVVATDEIGDIYSPRSYLNDALLQPETRSAYRGLLGAGLDRLAPAPAPRPADLYLLGLLPQPVRARRRLAHRPPAAQPACVLATRVGRCRQVPARAREAERPRADLDRPERLRRRSRSVVRTAGSRAGSVT